jgi:hypothetical protein
MYILILVFKKPGGKHHSTRKAASWQKWEDNMFGHTMAAVASRRLPPVRNLISLVAF